MSDLNARAVLSGSLVDFGGTLVVSYLFYGLVALVGGTSFDGAAQVVDGSTGLQLTQLLVGLALTLAGAYVAATIARGAERTNAFAVGIVSTAISFVLVLTAPSEPASPFWTIAAGLMLTIPAAFVGGELRRWTLRRKAPR